jgi:isopentenyl-diphosphate Delta-isomerase
MPRAYRKDEHIYYSMRNSPGRADFSDIRFVHNCLPDCDLNDVSLETAYMGRTFSSPLFINAITGGTKLALKINANLAEVAKECGLPMAVGSQMAALENRGAEASFRIVRRVNPSGVVWANIGSYADPEMVGDAVRMINADGVQIHLNVPHELSMNEGDIRFGGMIERIKAIVESLQIPVMIKEVGFGIAREEAEILAWTGATAVDVGGRGGTNFIEIESLRSGSRFSKGLKNWGMPTAISLVEAGSVLRGSAELIAGGGMRDAHDIAKALSLGAVAAGMAGLPVYLLLKYGRRALSEHIKSVENELRHIMMMLGATSLDALRRTPLVITGASAEWMQRRGIDPSIYARRSRRG